MWQLDLTSIDVTFEKGAKKVRNTKNAKKNIKRIRELIYWINNEIEGKKQDKRTFLTLPKEERLEKNHILREFLIIYSMPTEKNLIKGYF